MDLHFYFIMHHRLWLSLFQCLELSKTSTQLDIQDTKLRGIIAIHRNGSEKLWILHSHAVPLAMTSNSVTYQETSHGKRSTKLHSVSTTIGKAKQQLALATATATAPAIYPLSYHHSITSAFAFLFAIVSLPSQFHTAQSTQHGSDILRAKNNGLSSVWPHLQIYKTTTSNRQDFGSAN